MDEKTDQCLCGETKCPDCKGNTLFHQLQAEKEKVRIAVEALEALRDRTRMAGTLFYRKEQIVDYALAKIKGEE